MVHTSYIQLYEGSTNQPLNWSFSLELETLLLVTLRFDSSVIATIDPSTGSVAINQGFTTRVNITWVNGNVTLIILNVTSADEGVYNCELTGSTNSWRRKIQVATLGNLLHTFILRRIFYSGRSLRRPILCGCPQDTKYRYGPVGNPNCWIEGEKNGRAKMKNKYIRILILNYF